MAQNFGALGHDSTTQYGTKHVRKATATQKKSLILSFPSNSNVLVRQRVLNIEITFLVVVIDFLKH